MHSTKAARKIALSLPRKGRNIASLSVVQHATNFSGTSRIARTMRPYLRASYEYQGSKSYFSSQSDSLSDWIHSKIESNKVMVFSKSTCPFCMATKNLFESMGVEAEIVELDLMRDGHAIQGELKTITGQRTVPNVFVGGKHVGGNDDVHAAERSGELQNMLQ